MSDYDVREKRSRSRKRNIMAKSLRDQGDHKGAFALRIVDSRKSTYKREKIKINEVLYEEETD